MATSGDCNLAIDTSGLGAIHPSRMVSRADRLPGWIFARTRHPAERSPCGTSIDPRRQLAAENACPVTRSGRPARAKNRPVSTIRRPVGLCGATDNTCRSPARLPHGRAPVASSGCSSVSVGGFAHLDRPRAEAVPGRLLIFARYRVLLFSGSLQLPCGDPGQGSQPHNRRAAWRCANGASASSHALPVPCTPGGRPPTVVAMHHVLGSERSQPLASKGNRAGQVTRERTDQLPAALCHAVPAGSDVAVCGEAGLVIWAQPWDEGSVDRCQSCLDDVPLSAS